MDCSTIIVSYNTFNLTVEAIKSALRAAGDLAHEVIVVDNNSPDNSGSRLHDAFLGSSSNVRILQNDHNVGFAAANNQGAQLATGDVLFFLNPDTVVHDGAIARIVEFIRSQPEVGAVGPRVLNADGTLQRSVFATPTPREILRHHLPISSLLRGADRRIDPIPRTTEPVEIVKGCALAVRASAFFSVGGWDEKYFMYSEETELCVALQQSGYVNYYFFDALVTHYGGAASLDRYDEEQVRIVQSAMNYLRRHNSSWHLLLYRLTGLAGYSFRVAIFTVLMWRYPDRRSEYQRRRTAARVLANWFATARP